MKFLRLVDINHLFIILITIYYNWITWQIEYKKYLYFLS